MKVMKIFLYLALVLALSSVSFAQSYNYEEMEMDEYECIISKSGKADLDAAKVGTMRKTIIADLTTQTDEIQAQIDATWEKFMLH